MADNYNAFTAEPEFYTPTGHEPVHMITDFVLALLRTQSGQNPRRTKLLAHFIRGPLVTTKDEWRCALFGRGNALCAKERTRR